MNKIKNIFQHHAMFFTFAIIGVAIFLRFFKLLDKSLWIDESARYLISKLSIPEIIRIARLSSFSSGLYNILLHFWFYVGDSEFLVRLFPLLFGVISIIVFLVVVKKLYPREINGKVDFSVILLATLLLAVSPMHIHYSQEGGGPYTLYFLLILISSYLFLKITENYFQKPFKYFLGFILLLAFCFYLHYFTINFILAYNLVFVFYYSVFMKHGNLAKWLTGLWKWFFSLLVLLIIISPVLSTILFQTSRGQPGPVVRLLSLSELFFTFNMGQWYFHNRKSIGIVFFIIFVISMFSIFKRRSDDGFKKDLLLFLFLVFSVMSGFLLGLKTNAFRPRYSSPLISVYLILLARGLAFVEPKFIRSVFIIFIIICSFFSLHQYYFEQPYWEKEPWREAAVFVNENSLADDLIVFPISNEQPAFDYYYRKYDLQLKTRGLIRDYDILKGPVHAFDVSPEDLINQFKNITQGSSRVWIVTARATIGIPTSPKGIGHLVLDCMNSNEKYSNVISKYIGGRMNVFLYAREE